MGSRSLQRGLSFILLTIGLTWAWVLWGEDAYQRLLLTVAGPALEMVGVHRIAQSPARQRFVSVVPFFVLMCVTPGMSLRRRVIGTLAGFAFLLLAHAGLVGVEQWAQSNRRPTARPFGTLFPAVLFADGLPFMLWAVIAHRYLSGLFARVMGGRGSGDAGN